MYHLTAIDDSSRNLIAQSIERLRANGGTCLGAGLKRGLDVRKFSLEVILSGHRVGGW